MNIFDYCIWRGDVSLSYDGFNYVDALILSQLSYYPFESLIINGEKCTISKLYTRVLTSSVSTSSERNKDEFKLLRLLSMSKRFKNLNIHNYVSITNSHNIEQFSVMMVDLDLFTIAVVFRGTDDSLTGWHEDLQLSYRDINSQFDAVKYVNKYCHFPKKYILLGHSKGGCLSLYAAVNIKKRKQKRIDQILSFDGPGLRDGSYSIESFNRIKDRYIKFVPEFDVVGMIYYSGEKCTIVKSTNKGIMQHFAYSWEVENNKFITLNKLNDNTKLVKKVLDNFFLKTSLKEREVFVYEIFNGFREIKIKSIFDINFNDISFVVKLVKMLDSLSDNSKKIASIIISETVNIFENKIMKDVNKVLFNWVDKHKFW